MTYWPRRDDLTQAARGVDVLVVATPDSDIAEVAARVVPVPSTVVLHLSGALGLDAVAPHPRRASLHPLVPLPSAEVGRVRLRSGITFAVAGDPVAGELARLLGGSVVVVGDEHRAAYHAAACIASNHLVALMGQVERVAASAGLDLDAFVGLARAALTDVSELGPAPALTGPAAAATRPPSSGTAPRWTPPRSPGTKPAWPWPGGWRPTAPPPTPPRRGASRPSPPPPGVPPGAAPRRPRWVPPAAAGPSGPGPCGW